MNQDTPDRPPVFVGCKATISSRYNGGHGLPTLFRTGTDQSLPGGSSVTVTEVAPEYGFSGGYRVRVAESDHPGFSVDWLENIYFPTPEAPMTEIPARPTINISDRGTARQYARELSILPRLAPDAKALLSELGDGLDVDAYALNAALTNALRRVSAERSGRGVLARHAAHLAHITQAVLENHADNLPAYAEGERSRKIQDLEEELEGIHTAAAEVTRQLNLQTAEVESLKATRALNADSLRLSAERLHRARARARENAAEVARLTEENARILSISEGRDALLAETVRDRDNLAATLTYALEYLPASAVQRVLGFQDGVNSP